MTEQEGRKYTQRADETRLFIDELESKKDKTETDLQSIEDLKAKSSENKPKKLVESSRQSSPKVSLKTSALVFSLSLLLAR
jgi:hypothetical protein